LEMKRVLNRARPGQSSQAPCFDGISQFSVDYQL